MALPSGAYAPRDDAGSVLYQVALAGVLFRALHRHLHAWAHTRGLRQARSGAVIVVQRFGGALNLNVDLHALVLDGVFARAGDGRLRFHRAPAPTAADVANVLAAIVPGVRARPECLCRYVLRAPVTGDRLSVAADGRVVLHLLHPWADGMTHRAFEPTALLERLAVLVPRPRVNLLLCYGVLAPHAAWRAEVVPRGTLGVEPPGVCAESDAAVASVPSPAGRRWADLMRRAFDVDVLACPRAERGPAHASARALRRSAWRCIKAG